MNKIEGFEELRYFAWRTMPRSIKDKVSWHNFKREVGKEGGIGKALKIITERYGKRIEKERRGREEGS
jgi:hypothetical protein